jgi:hypothetical protein
MKGKREAEKWGRREDKEKEEKEERSRVRRRGNGKIER